MAQVRVNTSERSNASDKQARLLDLEIRLARRRGFWQGLLVSLFLTISVVGAGALYVWAHPKQVLEWAASYFLLDVAREVFASFPDAYMTHNRDHVLLILDEFTNAVAANKVSRRDFAELGQMIFLALEDRKLTYQEVNGFVERMSQMSEGWRSGQ